MNQKRNTKYTLSDVELGKKLSWLLRHGAVKEGLTIQSNGFVNVESILRHPKYASYFSQAVLEHLVANDKKQRYMLRKNNNSYEIRANQGHSIETVKSEACQEQIKSLNEIPMAVHGTYFRFWQSIKIEGLRKMKRNHIHFATFDENLAKNVLNETRNNISGFRSDCQILIYLNVPKVLEDECMKLYRSANGVVLCDGINGNGIIPKEYFYKVIERRTGKLLEY